MEPRASPAAAAPGFNLKDPKLDAHLVRVAEAAGLAGSAGLDLTPDAAATALPPELRAALRTGALRLTPAGDVQVHIGAGDTTEAAAQLAALGITVERLDEAAGVIQAQVPAALLLAVAALPQVRSVSLPVYPAASAGVVSTEGDAVLRSASVRNTFGVNGSGVIVGVISDGVRGLGAALASGDVPLVDTTTCNITGANPSSSGAEGTAMLEIVHDIAPGATLMFGNFSTPAGLGTTLDFNEAVDCLADHADIVVDDIAWYGVGPYDGTSIVSRNTANALNGTGPIRGYYTAAGNAADRHYQGGFIDSGEDYTNATSFWGLHEFGEEEDLPIQHAGLASSPATVNRFVLAPGGAASIILQWDEPWGGAGNDYDLFVGEGQNIIVCGASLQDGNDNPMESCSVENTTGNNLTVDILIGNHRFLAEDVTFDLFLLCLSGCIPLSNQNLLDFNTPASSVAAQADAGGSPVSVVTVGAVRFSVPVIIERYSSRGPTEDGRIKPDIIATDGICVSGAGNFKLSNASCQTGSGRTFSGTSAAAPHVAGIAALLLQCNGALTRAGLRDAILDNADDIGLPGTDSVYGHGRIDALAFARAVLCGADTPTPTVTRTPTETRTPTITPNVTETPTPTPPCPVGDASRNQQVNSVDAALIQQFVAQLIPGVACAEGADANQDGRINAIDAALILQFEAGLINQLPP
jgi:subtilisin family serine protease